MENTIATLKEAPYKEEVFLRGRFSLDILFEEKTGLPKCVELNGQHSGIAGAIALNEEFLKTIKDNYGTPISPPNAVRELKLIGKRDIIDRILKYAYYIEQSKDDLNIRAFRYDVLKRNVMYICELLNGEEFTFDENENYKDSIKNATATLKSLLLQSNRTLSIIQYKIRIGDVITKIKEIATILESSKAYGKQCPPPNNPKWLERIFGDKIEQTFLIPKTYRPIHYSEEELKKIPPDTEVIVKPTYGAQGDGIYIATAGTVINNAIQYDSTNSDYGMSFWKEHVVQEIVNSGGSERATGDLKNRPASARFFVEFSIKNDGTYIIDRMVGYQRVSNPDKPKNTGHSDLRAKIYGALGKIGINMPIKTVDSRIVNRSNPEAPARDVWLSPGEYKKCLAVAQDVLKLISKEALIRADSTKKCD